MTLLLALLVACVTPPEPPAPQPGVPARGKAQRPPNARQPGKTPGKAPQGRPPMRGKQPGKAPVRGKQPGKAPAAPPKPPPAPVGAAGPLTGVLTLTAVEPKPPAPPAEGAPPAPPAPPAVPKTKAEMKLTWEGGEKQLVLGEVPGKCAEIAPYAVGPEGKQQTPLWAVKCTHKEASAEIFMLQVKNLMLVVRKTEPTGKIPARFQTVKRVPLTAGAVLQKGK